MSHDLFKPYTISAGYFDNGDLHYFAQKFPTIKDAKRVTTKFLNSSIGVCLYSGIMPEKIKKQVFIETENAFYCRSIRLDNGIPKPGPWQTIKR